MKKQLMTVNSANKNGRIYHGDVVQKALEDYLAKGKPVFVQTGFQTARDVSLENICGIVEDIEVTDTTFRDGGSQGYYVKNMDECGYQLVVQDFSINAKRNGSEGSWYARRPSPDHVEKHPIDVQRVSFV